MEHVDASSDDLLILLTVQDNFLIFVKEAGPSSQVNSTITESSVGIPQEIKSKNTSFQNSVIPSPGAYGTELESTYERTPTRPCLKQFNS